MSNYLDQFARIRRIRGTESRIARTLKLAHQTIALWKRVPLDHVFAVSEIVGVPPERLRPDFFRNDPLRRIFAMSNRKPSPADVAIGIRIRELRKAAKLSQTALGNAIGQQYQMIQKIEKGRGRISAGNLYLVARKLGQPISAFYTNAEIACQDSGIDFTGMRIPESSPTAEASQ